MKGALLLLTLLVIGELGFQTTEACLPFFTAYGGVLSGSKLWLNHELDAYNATTGEREAYEKIQQCFSEGGLKSKFLEPKILEAMVISPECLSYYGNEIVAEITALLNKLQLH
ncbi:secretoglobin family 2B member 24-like [Rattus rattus]|uniref:secretoglobin family 2B member 24-like n=1 Tax=Rattus rattus TaxID=10117 RepID=UPI0013F320CC|nr:secretoglobin family 2B member 24-like [Rattus rattus]